MATQTQRRDAARSRLLDAALERTAEVGFSATSITDIAQRAGMSRGSPNFHFGSKEQMLLALIYELAQRWSDLVLRRPQASSLEELLDGHCLPLLEHPELVAAAAMLAYEVIGPSPGQRPALTAHHARLLTYLADQIAAAQTAGLVASHIRPRELAAMLLGAIAGLIMTQDPYGQPVPEAAYREFKTAVLARIANAP